MSQDVTSQIGEYSNPARQASIDLKMGKIGLTECLAVFINALDLDLTMTSPAPSIRTGFLKTTLRKRWLISVETLFWSRQNIWGLTSGSYVRGPRHSANLISRSPDLDQIDTCIFTIGAYQELTVFLVQRGSELSGTGKTYRNVFF